MEDEKTTPDPRTRRRVAGAVGLLAAGALAGGVLAGTWTASAADGSPTPSSSAPTGTTAPDGSTRTDGKMGDSGRGPGGSDPVRGDETRLTGADATKAEAAAQTAVPGGTVIRVETDAGDAAYEVHMTTSDGTLVTVKLDKSFAVVQVQDGMGKGDPGPADVSSTA